MGTFAALEGGAYNNILTQYRDANDPNHPDNFVHNDVVLKATKIDPRSPTPPIPVPLDIGVETPLHGIVALAQIRGEVVDALNNLFHVVPDYRYASAGISRAGDQLYARRLWNALS